MDPTDLPRKRTGKFIFRIMLSGIFLVAGTNHMLRHDNIVERLDAAPLGWLATSLAPADPLVTLAGIGLLSCGAGLMIGFKTRWAALGLIAIVIPITVTVQIGSVETLGPLFKNIGLLGGLTYFATHGARSWSLDDILDHQQVRRSSTSTN